MGPLMIPKHPFCLKEQKSPKGWGQYIKGASAIFAWQISKGEKVIVLTPPPPERFHPSGQTNYQTIEEPILKRLRGDGIELRIEMVHPMIKEAEHFIYQMWPNNDTHIWIERFGSMVRGTPCWRLVKATSKQAGSKDSKVHAVIYTTIEIAKDVDFEGNERSVLKNTKASEKEASKARKALEKKASKEKAFNDKALKEEALKTKALMKKASKEAKALEKKEKKKKKKKDKVLKKKVAKEKAANEKAANEKAANEKALKANVSRKAKVVKEKASKKA
ncbi:hypothetical protein PVAG01_00209 [Phlyctema vagabunda]|uniref:Uncharacterized protein n=1 Tax=Phlyctema vagabunda TaxID=108571 RepID=A0ABR4PTK3_9HELO